MTDMEELPKRKSHRLQGYDYSRNGYYFVTICTENRKPIFWKTVGADIIRPQKSNPERKAPSDEGGYKRATTQGRPGSDLFK